LPIVPLGIGAYKRASGFVPEVKLRNFYLEQDKSGVSPDKVMRIQRPGLTHIYDYGSTIRGVHFRTSTGEQLVASGGQLYSFANAKGALPDDLTIMVSTPFVTAIKTGNAIYLYDITVTPLVMPDDAPGEIQDIDQLNGYLIVLMTTGRFYWMVPGETTIDPFDFATAESLPDGGMGIRRLGDEFWIGGAENFEVWQTTGDLDAPFQRAAGRNFERGLLYRDSLRRFDNTLVWVGDDYQVYRASSVPQVISDSGISERIRKALGDCTAWTFGLDGHSFYVLTIPGQGTFVYDPSIPTWMEWNTLGEDSWLPWAGYQEQGAIVAGSSSDGKLWAVDPEAADDDGAAIERIVTATVPILGKPPRNDSVSIGIGSSADCTIRLRWKDGQDDYPDYYDEIEVRAPLDVATLWRLGQPDQPYRTLEVSCVDSAQIRIAGLIVNEGWQ
jgi:hypothetical protein